MKTINDLNKNDKFIFTDEPNKKRHGICTVKNTRNYSKSRTDKRIYCLNQYGTGFQFWLHESDSKIELYTNKEEL